MLSCLSMSGWAVRAAVSRWESGCVQACARGVCFRGACSRVRLCVTARGRECSCAWLCVPGVSSLSLGGDCVSKGLAVFASPAGGPWGHLPPNRDRQLPRVPPHTQLLPWAPDRGGPFPERDPRLPAPPATSAVRPQFLEGEGSQSGHQTRRRPSTRHPGRQAGGRKAVRVARVPLREVSSTSVSATSHALTHTEGPTHFLTRSLRTAWQTLTVPRTPQVHTLTGS